MKYNKGFALLALLAIIAGVLVVGGGAYLLGKKGNVKIPPNVIQPIDDKKVSDCLPTTAPWIKVVSPNGGENYTTGQQITVKWDSCNIPKETQVFAQLAEGTGEGEYNEGPGGIEGIAYYSLNDGSEIINLLPEMFGGVGELYYSKNYRIQITLSSNNKVFDYSDNFFAINNVNISLDTTNQYVKTYKTLFTSEFAKPINFDHFRVVAVGCGSSCMYLYALDKDNGKVYRVSDKSFSDYSFLDNQIRATNQSKQTMGYTFDSSKNEFNEKIVADFFIEGPWPNQLASKGCTPMQGISAPVVLSPNGGEVYKAGQQITLNWKSCVSSDESRGTVGIFIFMPSAASGTGMELVHITADDGSEVVTLPTLSSWKNMYYGKNFKIQVWHPQYEGIASPSDSSDDTFTIQ